MNANLYLIGFVVTVLLVLMNMKMTIRVFAIPSVIALAATAFGLALILAYIFSTGVHDITSIPLHTTFSETLVALGIFIFTFEGVALVSRTFYRLRSYTCNKDKLGVILR